MRLTDRALLCAVCVLCLVFALGAATPGGPIKIDVASFDGQPLLIQNRTIEPTGPDQNCIELAWPDALAVPNVTLVLDNVTCRTGSVSGLSFKNCLVLTNAWNARVEGLNCYGAYGGDLQNGITLLGKSHDVRIEGATIMHAVTGIYIPESGEGTIIHASTLLGVTYGIFARSDYAGRPWLVIADSHIAASRAGIVLVNRKQVSIHDDLIYRHMRGYNPADPNWNGIVLINATEASLRDVFIDGAPNTAETYPGTSRGVYTDLPLNAVDVSAVRVSQ